MKNLDVALKNLKISVLPPKRELLMPPRDTHVFVYVQSGSFLYSACEKCYVARQNQLALMPAGLVQFFHPLPEDILRVISFPMAVGCHNMDFVDFFGLSENSLVINIPEKVIEEIYEGITAFSAEDAPFLSRLYGAAFGMQLCTLYMRTRTEGDPSEEAFAPVLAHMEAHLAEDISLEELSHILHFNPVYFSQKFKDIFHISPMRYLALLRAGRAAQLLFDTDLSVQKIGEKIGFSNQYYFRTFFGKYVGLSPDDFRKKYDVK